jgi:hypothetical protein
MSIKNYSDINKMDDLMIPPALFRVNTKITNFRTGIRPSTAAEGTDRPVGLATMDSQTVNTGYCIDKRSKDLEIAETSS